MENIDLTLENEFTADRRRGFDDERRYNEALGYKDQRKAISSILGKDTYLFSFVGLSLESKDYLKFFGDDQNEGWSEIKNHETICDITGIMTKTLRMEYDAGFGNENVCDCCGGFISDILNKDLYWLCESCAKSGRYQNKLFWEGEKPAFDNWID